MSKRFIWKHLQFGFLTIQSNPHLRISHCDPHDAWEMFNKTTTWFVVFSFHLMMSSVGLSEKKLSRNCFHAHLALLLQQKFYLPTYLSTQENLKAFPPKQFCQNACKKLDCTNVSYDNARGLIFTTKSWVASRWLPNSAIS